MSIFVAIIVFYRRIEFPFSFLTMSSYDGPSFEEVWDGTTLETNEPDRFRHPLYDLNAAKSEGEASNGGSSGFTTRIYSPASGSSDVENYAPSHSPSRMPFSNTDQDKSPSDMSRVSRIFREVDDMTLQTKDVSYRTTGSRRRSTSVPTDRAYSSGTRGVIRSHPPKAPSSDISCVFQAVDDMTVSTRIRPEKTSKSGSRRRGTSVPSHRESTSGVKTMNPPKVASSDVSLLFQEVDELTLTTNDHISSNVKNNRRLYASAPPLQRPDRAKRAVAVTSASLPLQSRQYQTRAPPNQRSTANMAFPTAVVSSGNRPRNTRALSQPPVTRRIDTALPLDSRQYDITRNIVIPVRRGFNPFDIDDNRNMNNNSNGIRPMPTQALPLSSRQYDNARNAVIPKRRGGNPFDVDDDPNMHNKSNGNRPMPSETTASSKHDKRCCLCSACIGIGRCMASRKFRYILASVCVAIIAGSVAFLVALALSPSFQEHWPAFTQRSAPKSESEPGLTVTPGIAVNSSSTSDYPSVAPTLVPDGITPEEKIIIPLPPPPPLVFYVMGDIPYSASEAEQLSVQLSEIPTDARFIFHLGDMQNPKSDTACTSGSYAGVANIFQTYSKYPIFPVPGDNDIVDCPNPTAALEYWRAFLAPVDQYWNHAIPVVRQEERFENFAFIAENVLFVGVHLVNGGNSDMLEDALAWLSTNINNHPSVAALVFVAHGRSRNENASFFEPFASIVQDWGIPALWVHGDGHSYYLREGAFGVEKLTELQVDQGKKAPPLKVIFQLNSTVPFQFDRRKSS